jgi:uncharacterized membrane protein YecN with MAPEG domain
MQITTFYAGIFGIFLILLSTNVIRHRIKKRVLLLDDNDYELSLAIRAHGNFTEYTPIFLILLFLLELNHTSTVFLSSIAIAFFVGRSFHAYSFIFRENKNKLDYKCRQTGMVLTFLVIIISSVFLIIKSF